MKNGWIARSAYVVLVSAACSGAANADIYNFDFTGRMTVTAGGQVVQGSDVGTYGGYQTPISASLTYDTVTGLGNSALSISLGASFLGNPAIFHDISLTRIGNTNLFNGQLLADYGNTSNIPLHIEWDATGFLNAVNSGAMIVGDKISGNTLYRDVLDDGSYSQTVIPSLGSAKPYSDTLLLGKPGLYQHYAPLAATAGTQGINSGPFNGVKVYLDIGSGNSMYVTSITPVPEPEAWGMMLAGLGLVGWAARRRKG